MGRLTVNGLDALSDDFAALARLPDKVVEEILDAEAEVILPAQREEIEKQWRGPHSLGISAKSIKKGKVKKDKDGRSLTIYPRGPASAAVGAPETPRSLLSTNTGPRGGT